MRVSIALTNSAVMPTIAPPPYIQDVVRKLVDFHIVRPEPHVHIYADDQYCMICGKDGRTGNTNRQGHK